MDLIRRVSNKNRYRLYYLFFITIYSLPVVYGFYYIHINSVNVPFWDQWGPTVVWMIDYLEGDFDFYSLIQQQGDSRPALTNLLIFMISLLTNINIKVTFYLGYITYILCTIILIYFIRKDIGLNITILVLLIPIFYYSFNPYYMTRFIQNLGSVYYPIFIITALITIYLLDLSRDSDWCFFGSIFMGLMCTFSFAAGLTIWLAGLVQLSIQNMTDKKIKIIIWIITSSVIFYFYFKGMNYASQGLHSTDAYSAFYVTLMNYPIQKFLCFMGTLGSQVMHDKNTSFIFGMIMSLIFIYLIHNNLKSIELNRLSKWYGLLTLSVLTTLEVALTRSGSITYSFFGSPDTIFFIPNQRHSLAIFLPIICIYVITIYYTKASISQKQLNKSNPTYLSSNFKNFQNIFILGMLFLLISLGAVLHIIPGIEVGREIHNQQIANLYYLETYKIQADGNLEKLYPSATVVRKWAQSLEDHSLHVFANGPININTYKTLHMDTYSHIDMLNHTLLHTNEENIFINTTKTDALEISGWAVDKNANGPAKAVFITIDDELYIPTIYGLDRSDVADFYNNRNFRYSGFRGSFASSILEDGPHNFTIKIVSKEGDGYYTSNQIVPFVCI